MDKPRLIITHDGLAHADEIFTIALILKVLGAVEIERRRLVTEVELNDPSVWVLDQASRYEPALHNFDHHQDKALSATNVLVLDYLRENKIISEDLYLLLRRPFGGISDYDKNGPLPFNGHGFQVSEFFKVFNNFEEGFEAALAFAGLWLDGIEELLNKKQQAILTFKDGVSLDGIVRICSDYPVLWTAMGSERILVAPEKGEWRVHSADTDKYPLLSTGKEKFLHSNRFVASFNNKADAVEAAKLAAGLLNQTNVI